MNEEIRILLIEDDPGDVDILREILSEATGLDYKLECADCLTSGLNHLIEIGADLLLLDLGLPESSGLDTLAYVVERVKDIPIIVLTGLDDDVVGMEAVRKGAQDYLVKGQVDGNLLVRVVRYSIERKKVEKRMREIIESKRVLERIRIEEEKRKQLIINTTHLLHTPLTIVNANLELVKQGIKELSPELIDKLIERLHEVIGLIDGELYSNIEMMTVETSDGFTAVKMNQDGM